MRAVLVWTGAMLLSLQAMSALAVEELTWGDLVPPEARDMMGMPQPTHDLSALADALSDE